MYKYNLFQYFLINFKKLWKISRFISCFKSSFGKNMFKFYLKNCFRLPHSLLCWTITQNFKTVKWWTQILFYNWTLVHCWWDYKMVKPLWKIVLEFLKKVCKEPRRGIAAASYSYVAPTPPSTCDAKAAVRGEEQSGLSPYWAEGLSSSDRPPCPTWRHEWWIGPK